MAPESQVGGATLSEGACLLASLGLTFLIWKSLREDAKIEEVEMTHQALRGSKETLKSQCPGAQGRAPVLCTACGVPRQPVAATR